MSNLTSSQIRNLVANKMRGENKGKADDEAMARIKDALRAQMNTDASKTLRGEAVKVAEKEKKKGESGPSITGTIANLLYSQVEEVITEIFRWCDDLSSDIQEKAKCIMRGLMYAECVAIAVEVVLSLGMIVLLSVVEDVIEGAISVITEVTGFIWSVFVKVIQSPVLWAGITGIGIGLAFANPLGGVVIAGIGAIGTALTL